MVLRLVPFGGQEWLRGRRDWLGQVRVILIDDCRIILFLVGIVIMFCIVVIEQLVELAESGWLLSRGHAPPFFLYELTLVPLLQILLGLLDFSGGGTTIVMKGHGAFHGGAPRRLWHLQIDAVARLVEVI